MSSEEYLSQSEVTFKWSGQFAKLFCESLLVIPKLNMENFFDAAPENQSSNLKAEPSLLATTPSFLASGSTSSFCLIIIIVPR